MEDSRLATNIIINLEALKLYYKSQYDILAEEFEKSSYATTMVKIHKEMDKYQHYYEAIQTAMNVIRPFITEE